MSVIRRRSPVAADADPTRAKVGRRRHAGRRRVGRPTSWGGLAIRGSLIVAAGTAALALAGPFALRPFVDAAGAAGTASEVSVAFVLDFGGSPDREVTGCVAVPASDNDYDALAAFTAEHGLAAPTYNSVDLLCSIAGDPATGCGQAVLHGYIYWSYFTGSADHWTYSDSGASGLVTPNVQGWRFQDPGTGLPNDPPPHTAPDYAALCSSTSPTTPTTPVSTDGGVGGGPRARGAGTTRTTRPPPDSRTKKAIAAAAAARAASTPTSSSTTTTSTYPPITTTTLPAINIPADPETGLASVSSKHATPGPGPDPLILGGLLVAALAIAAYARWRKRPRTP